TPGSSLLRILRVSDDPGILAALAAHPNSPAQLLRDLPWGQQPPIRSGLAGNPTCPLDLLYAILPETTMVDRKRMAAHPAADGALLQTLWEVAGDDVYLRGEVIANSAC